MQTFRVEPPVTWEIIAVSYEKGDVREGGSKKINEVKAMSSGRPITLFTREEVIDLLDKGRARFLITVKPKPDVRVVPSKPKDPEKPYSDRYLRSDADEKLSDNLGELTEYDALGERMARQLGSKAT